MQAEFGGIRSQITLRCGLADLKTEELDNLVRAALVELLVCREMEELAKGKLLDYLQAAIDGK